VNKSPGSAGIGLEFYKANWGAMQGDIGAMINQMFMERKVSAHHKASVSEEIASMWYVYVVVYDIGPNNERLHVNRLV